MANGAGKADLAYISVHLQYEEMPKTTPRKPYQTKYNLKLRNMRKGNKNSFHLAEDHKLTGEKQWKTMGKGFKTALVSHV